MPPTKRISHNETEQKEFRVFDPSNVKQTTEVPVKPLPSIEELTTIEKKGKTNPIKKTTRKKSRKKTTKKSSKSTSKFTKAKPAEFKPTKLKKNGYTLIVTEKPQAAGKIAAALSEGKDKKLGQKTPYYELERNGKSIVVACAVGHLFSVSQTVKGTEYPIFDIAWFQNAEVRKKDFTKQYYLQLKRLIKGASELIIATDFDIEGEVIGYNVMRFIAQQSDAKRMKFSALTAGEIQKAYDNARPTIEWGQAIAGETRHFLDWLYGINLSRALMSSIKSIGKFRIMSIGRVQGPTLKLIVDKEKIIQAFKPTPYWQVFLTVNDGKNKLEVKHNKDIVKKDELEKFKNLEGKKAQATTKKTKQIIKPPAPFDLTALQTEAYKFHGLTPSRTLQIAQKLYLAGLISYPRTSSQKIPQEAEPLKILKQLSNHFSETQHTTRKKPIEGNKTDPAHPAITPTGIYQALEGQDEKIYELVVKRFISCFCDDAEIENKRIEVTIDNLKFSEKGLEIKKPGWMNVYPTKTQEKEIKDMNGEVLIEKVNIEEKETQPPRRFTPASILTELEKRNLGTKCLTEDSEIFFNGTLMPLKKIFTKAKYPKKEKKTVIKRINGTIISLNKTQTPQITSTNLISRRKINENEKIIEIETNNTIIKVTENHLIYIYKNNKIEQIKAKNLQINDKLVGITKTYDEGKQIIKKSIFNKKYKINEKEIKHKFASKTSKGILISKFPIKWSTPLAWVLGYYYGDGSYDSPKYNGSHSISFSTTEQKAVKLLEENVKEIFGHGTYAYNLGTKYKINLNSVMAYALIKTFPELDGKHPFNIPQKFIGDFLRGFFDADGNVHLRPLGKTKIKDIKCNSFNTPRAKFTLANQELIQWVKELLHKIGIKTKINKGVTKCNGKSFDCYTILISGRDKIEKFSYLVGFNSYKEEILYKRLKCDSRKYRILKDSAKIYVTLSKFKSLKIEKILEETNLSRYRAINALRILAKKELVTKKRYTNRNKHIYNIIENKKYSLHCIKLLFNKIKKDIYSIPIKKLSTIKKYNGYVYDLSVNPQSPNFITKGNILVHNSTRANILETLYDRNYIKEKSIKATELGIRLIDSLQKHSPVIIDEKLTREIEKDMDNIRNSKKDLEKKEKITIKKAEKAITKISLDFHKKEKDIGKELVAATEAGWAEEKEANKLLPCPLCKKGMLTIKYTPRFKSYFVACTEYPKCKQTFSLPQGLIKKTEKICEECNFPMLLRIKQGKRPWQFCFNPKCPSRKELDLSGNTKKGKPRYTGKSPEIKNKKQPEKVI